MSLLDKIFKKKKEKPKNLGKRIKKGKKEDLKRKEEGKSKKVKVKKKKRKISLTPGIACTVRTPLITEKATFLSEKGQYVFEVERKSSKRRIKEVIEKIFSVNVEKVRVINIKGKVKKYRSRAEGKRRDRKKAIVTLSEGEKIELFEGI